MPAPSVQDPIFAAQVSVRDAREVLIPLLLERPAARRSLVRALVSLAECRDALDEAARS